MTFDLFQIVSLKCDVPEHQLRSGDVATLIDFVAHPSGGENGCVLEVFNALGESISVVALPLSSIEALRADEILSVRALKQAS